MSHGKGRGWQLGALLGDRVAELCVTALKWLLCLLFFGLLIANLLYFANLIDNAENVAYIFGFPFWNILYCAGILAGAYLLYRSGLLDKIGRKKMETGLLIFVAVTSLVWIFMAYDVPKYDSQTIVEAAERFMSGDYSPLDRKSSYLQCYPFQLPFLFYVERIYRLTGPGRYMLLRLLNVCYVVGIYKCLLKIRDFLLPEEREKKLVTVFLFGFWQPIFLTTFIYGTIPSILCFLLAICALLDYLKEGGDGRVLVSGVLLGVAILLKSNAWINWIAVGIIVALLIAKGGKKRMAEVLLIAAVVAILGQNMVERHYQTRSGYPIEDGTPKMLWLAMGLQEGNAAPGWYNGFPYDTLKSVDFDGERAAELGWTATRGSIDEFIRRPAYAVEFFAKKEVSLWCEPTYECLNASCHREREKPMGEAAKSLYSGAAHDVLLFHLRGYQILSLLGALVYCLRVKKDTVRLEHLVIPLTVLGGFLFHTFMEAKSTYVFPYYTMMTPFAWAGVLSLFSALERKGREKNGRAAG